MKRHQNGIIRGFRIRYYEYEKGPSTAQTVTVMIPHSEHQRKRRMVEVTYDFHSQEITGLEVYTDYVIQILGYTNQDGIYSNPLRVRTGEDGNN